MAEVGVVKEVKGDDVVVSLVRHEACKHCNACSHGHNDKEMILEAGNACQAKVGDHVMVSLKVSPFLQASFIMYGIPLIALFVGIFAGYTLQPILQININQEIMSIICGLGLLAVTYVVIAMNEKRFKKKKFKPQAIRIVEGE